MNHWVNFHLVKNAVTMTDVLARYAVCLETAGLGVLRGRCPLPTHESASAGSFSVDTRRNIWACHSQSCVAARGGCIGGNVLDFVACMEGCTIRQAALLLQGWFSVSAVSGGRETASGKSRTQPTPSNRVLGFRLSSVDPSHAYIANRGITVSTARYFGVGFYSGPGIMSQRVAIPIHNQSGELVAYAGRSIHGEQPKYRLPPGFRKAAELFNLHRAAQHPAQQRVILVEGFFDCMKVYQVGHPNVVGLMGCSLSDTQAELLAGRFQEVVLLLDGDEAGRMASDKIAARLSSAVKIYRGQVPPNRQPDDLTSAELLAIIDAAVKWDDHKAR
jgi:DNA primase